MRQDTAEEIIAWLNSDASQKWRERKFHPVRHSADSDGDGIFGYDGRIYSGEIAFAALKVQKEYFDSAHHTLSIEQFRRSAESQDPMWGGQTWEPDADPTRI